MCAFDRWNPHEKSTWVFQVFKTYDMELEKNIRSYYPVYKYIFTDLKNRGALWENEPRKFLPMTSKSNGLFKTIKKWATSFDNFHNWANLNFLMAISSNFETYLETVIKLALQSDPGCLIGASKNVDGIELLKYDKKPSYDIQQLVTNCVKGDWNSRWENIIKIFPNFPNDIKSNIKDLEYIRNTRNKVGHAFGRDIEKSREFSKKTILPTTRLDTNKVIKLKQMVYQISKNIDKYLLENHIGEYQVLEFYHSIYPSLNKQMHINKRAAEFKKELGRTNVLCISKEKAQDICSYYESL